MKRIKLNARIKKGEKMPHTNKNDVLPMTVQTIQKLIAKSEQRVQQLQDSGIYNAEKVNYQAGYQNALHTVLSCLKFIEEMNGE